MFQGVSQLAKLTLAADGRRLGLHGLRLGMVATLYLAVCYFQSTMGKSASGLKLFQSQLQITVFFLSMTAVFGFSQIITEEKEEDTLGLMRLADISPLTVIVGKVASVFCDAGLLVAIQIPFTMVAITLGGISWPQVIAAYVALIAYLWMLVFVGVLASVTQPTGSTAARLTAIVVGAYLLLPPVIIKFSALWGTSVLSSLIDRISLPMRLMEVTESGFVDSPWSAAVVFGLVVGLVCLAISWMIFDRFSLNETVSERPLRLTNNQRSSLRSWSKPVIWREYIFCGGGIPWTIVRITIPFGISLCVYLWQFCFWQWTHLGLNLAWSSIFCGLFGLLDGSWSASRLFRDEIRYRTWSSVVQTPCSIQQLIFDKYCGWTLALAPTIAAPFLLVALMLIFHDYVFDFWVRVEITVATLSFAVGVFGYLSLLVLLSLYFGWKATPMALTICFTAGFFYVSSISFGLSDKFRLTAYVVTDLAIVVLTWWFQKRIVKRLIQLAEIA